MMVKSVDGSVIYRVFFRVDSQDHGVTILPSDVMCVSEWQSVMKDLKMFKNASLLSSDSYYDKKLI